MSRNTLRDFAGAEPDAGGGVRVVELRLRAQHEAALQRNGPGREAGQPVRLHQEGAHQPDRFKRLLPVTLCTRAGRTLSHAADSPEPARVGWHQGQHAQHRIAVILTVCSECSTDASPGCRHAAGNPPEED